MHALARSALAAIGLMLSCALWAGGAQAQAKADNKAAAVDEARVVETAQRRLRMATAYDAATQARVIRRCTVLGEVPA